MFDNIKSRTNTTDGSTFWRAYENEGEFTQDFFGKFDPASHSYYVDTYWYNKYGQQLGAAGAFMGPYTTLQAHKE